jgi:hypothetical protein
MQIVLSHIYRQQTKKKKKVERMEYSRRLLIQAAKLGASLGVLEQIDGITTSFCYRNDHENPSQTSGHRYNWIFDPHNELSLRECLGMGTAFFLVNTAIGATTGAAIGACFVPIVTL